MAAAGVDEHDRSGRHPSAVDKADGERAVEPVVERSERRLGLGDRGHGSHCVVGLRSWQAEHGHHRIADALLDAAAVRLQHRAEFVEVVVEHGPQPLRVEPLGEGGRALEVRDDDRHQMLTGRPARALPKRCGTEDAVLPPGVDGGVAPRAGHALVSAPRDRRRAPATRW